MPYRLTFAAALLTLAATAAAEPLHVTIDRLIEAKAKSGGVPIAEVCDDAMFVRRAYLDFVGMIPTDDEARAFIDDKSPDKRVKLIDALLARPEYARRMTELFHVMLMERRGDHDGWLKYLRTSFEQNKPWDKMAAEMLSPNAEDEAARDAAFFITKRLEKYGQNPTDYPGLTRDVGRLFAGRDLQCAECHNHLFIDDYKQRDFQGLFIAFRNLSLRRDVKFPAVSEGLIQTKAEFASVFNKRPHKTGLVVPGGEEVDVPMYEKGQEWLVAPDRKKKITGVPKFSPLRELAARLATQENDLFAQNIVNRLWFVMMGRGIVHPLDMFHSENPPSHPQVLDALAKAFVAHKYDIKWLLRELAMTKTYQRSSKLPRATTPTKPDRPGPEAASSQNVPNQTFTVAIERRLSAEQLLWSVLRATGEYDRYHKNDLRESLADRRKRFLAAFANIEREPEREFAPSLRAALFVMNDEKMLEFLEPRKDNLVGQLAKMDDDGKVVDTLFLSIYSRRPNDAERQDVTAYLSTHGKTDRAEAIGQVAWAMLASTEFCVNH